MKAHLAICPIGIFACDGTGRIIDRELFERNSKNAARKLLQLRAGKAVQELHTLYSRVRKKFGEVTLEGENNFGLDVVTEFPNLCGKILREKIGDLSAESGFQPIGRFAHDLSMNLTEEKLKTELSKPDRRIIQVTNAISELEENNNVLAERLSEWYLLFYPEILNQVNNFESLAKLISKGKIERKNSMGADFNEQDLSTIRIFAEKISDSAALRENLGGYLDYLMQQNFPNLKAVAGSAIGAKLIASAGDAERLSKMASSKIQVLGAERALFRHLKEGTKPPKYGIILKHSFLQSVPQHFRGKIARALAAKISIAIKADVYSKEFIGETLRKGLEEKIRKIRGAGTQGHHMGSERAGKTRGKK